METLADAVNSDEKSELSKLQKAGIGAIGGICLSLLKLIEAQFYVGAASSNEIIVAYLTYLAYVILGMAVAIFFTDKDLPIHKCEKNALVMGLLAPSILIALISKPISVEETVEDPFLGLPDLGAFFISSAFADSHTLATSPSELVNSNAFTPNNDSQDVLQVKQEDLEPTIRESFLKSIGRPVPTENYAYVVGVSSSQDKAVEFAGSLNKILQCNSSVDSSACAQVLKPENSEQHFVTVGGFNTKENTKAIKTESIKHAFDNARIQNEVSAFESASQLTQGKIVRTDSFFK